MRAIEIGHIIRERRKVLKISTVQLAEYCGMSKTTINNIERGRANPSLEILNEILRFLGMEMQINIINTISG